MTGLSSCPITLASAAGFLRGGTRIAKEVFPSTLDFARRFSDERLVGKVRSEAGADDGQLPNIRPDEGSRSDAGSSLSKPLSNLYPRLPCRFCGGSSNVVCEICDGEGKFAKGGYHKKNPISLDHIVGSKWTAMERTFGWRHFRVQSKRKGLGKDWFVEMIATCDEATRFWVNFKNLKDRERWSMGWLQKAEILDANNTDAASMLVCKACKGKGRRPCSCTLRDPEETILDIIEV